MDNTIQINGDMSPSPIIQVGGNFNYADLPTGQYQILLAKLDGNERLLNQFLDQINPIDLQKITISELNNEIVIYKNRIDELLQNTDITEEVKALVRAGDIDGAEALVDRHYEEAVKTETTQLTAKLYERGVIKQLKLKYTEAAEMFEKAAALQPENTLYLNKAGIINNTLARYTKAIIFYQQALDRDLNAYGENHSTVATYRNNLGMTYQALGQYEKAIEYFELALATFRQVIHAEHPHIKVVIKNLDSAKLAKKMNNLW